MIKTDKMDVDRMTELQRRSGGSLKDRNIVLSDCFTAVKKPLPQYCGESFIFIFILQAYSTSEDT